MQTKNLLLFIVLSFAVMLGWGKFQDWMWPPPERKLDPVKSKLAKKDVPQEQDSVFSVFGIPLYEKGPTPRLEPRVAITPKVQPGPKEESIFLGDPSFFLSVELTSRGASARRVILTRFQAADELGLPMWDLNDPKVAQLLQLVSPFQVKRMRDNLIEYWLNEPYRHYTLYLYDKPEDDRPVDTLGNLVWKVAKKDVEPGRDRHEVVFVAELPEKELRITKTFTLAKGDYHIGLAVKLERTGGEAGPLRYQLAGAHGLPIEGKWYTQTYRNALVGREDKKRNIWRSFEDSRQIGHWGVGGEQVERQDKTIRYAAIAVQYFASAVVVDNDQEHQNFVDRVRATVEGIPNKDQPFLDDITVRVVSEPVPLKPEAPVEHKYILYNGPVKVRLLGHLSGDQAVAPELVERYENTLQLNTLTDYQSPGAMGTFANTIGLTWLIIKFTNLMHALLWALHHVVPIYGICIIMLTVIVRGMMFPVSRRQAATTMQMQEKMAKLAPDVKKLQEKYKDDFRGLNTARSELYLKHGINPLASLGGCLLLFAQLPIFMGLYFCLQESIHFRLNQFLWMPNLGAPDMLKWWGEGIPMISTPDSLGGLFYLGPFFNIMPVLAIGLMLYQQQKMMPPATDEQTQAQQTMMKYMMVFMGFMFYKVPAGLCLYFSASTLWGLIERRMIPKAPKPGEEENPGDAAEAKKKPKPPETTDDNPNGWRKRLGNWWEDVLDKAGKQHQAQRDPRDDKKKRRGDGSRA